MKKHFVIITDSTDTAAVSDGARNEITGFLQGKGWHVWHWFQDCWLVVAEVQQAMHVSELSNEIEALIPKSSYIVIDYTEQVLHASLSQAAIPWIMTHWSEVKYLDK